MEPLYAFSVGKLCRSLWNSYSQNCFCSVLLSVHLVSLPSRPNLGISWDFIFQIKVWADSGTAANFNYITSRSVRAGQYGALLNHSISEFKNGILRIAVLCSCLKWLKQLMYLFLIKKWRYFFRIGKTYGAATLLIERDHNFICCLICTCCHTSLGQETSSFQFHLYQCTRRKVAFSGCEWVNQGAINLQ